MKLTRNELNCAKDKQLESIGLRRQNNPGWMEKALAIDFTAEQLSRFYGSAGPSKLPPPPPRQLWKFTITEPDGTKHSAECYSRESLAAAIARVVGPRI